MGAKPPHHSLNDLVFYWTLQELSTPHSYNDKALFEIIPEHKSSLT
jgi:hypothetical protein